LSIKLTVYKALIDQIDSIRYRKKVRHC